MRLRFKATRRYLLPIIICFTTLSAFSQKPYKRAFPLLMEMECNSISNTFQFSEGMLKNAGFLLGSEISLNKKQTIFQQALTGIAFNKSTGNRFQVVSQTAWRPVICGKLSAEVKLGAGLGANFHPVQAFHLERGNWEMDNRPKTLIFIPAGAGLFYVKGKQIAYFLSYQTLLINGYNRTLPILPGNVLQGGVRIYFKKK